MGDGDPDLNPVENDENGDTAGTMSFLGHLDELRKRLIWPRVRDENVRHQAPSSRAYQHSSNESWSDESPLEAAAPYSAVVGSIV